MEIEDVVMKLVGPVDPVGESHTDAKRLDNLKVLCDVVGALTARIEHIAEAADTHLASVKTAKRYACDFLSGASSHKGAIPATDNAGGSEAAKPVEAPSKCSDGSLCGAGGYCNDCHAGVRACPESGKHCNVIDGECQTCGRTDGVREPLLGDEWKRFVAWADEMHPEWDTVTFPVIDHRVVAAWEIWDAATIFGVKGGGDGR